MMDSTSAFPAGTVVGKDDIVIGGIKFNINYSADMFSMESTSSSFVLPKTPEMVTSYYQLGQTSKIENIIDIGIFKGGSAVLFHELFKPRKLLALDISTKREPALDAYIAARSASETLRPFYECDQGDSAHLQELARGQFGPVPLDLVVDDASHSYRLTRVSFNSLFPYLRPGGFYVIEDWGWAHWKGWPHLPADYQEKGALFPQEPALTNLIFELIMTAASSPGLIAKVSVTFNMAVVEKGPEAVDPSSFDLGNYHVARSFKWQPIL